MLVCHKSENKVFLFRNRQLQTAIKLYFNTWELKVKDLNLHYQATQAIQIPQVEHLFVVSVLRLEQKLQSELSMLESETGQTAADLDPGTHSNLL